MKIHSLLLGLAAALTLPPLHADPMRPLAGAAGLPIPASNLPHDATKARPTEPALPPLLAIHDSAGGRRQALFGEQWLAEGERVGGQRLLAIHATRVELGQGKLRRTLHLLPELVASTPAAQAQSERGVARPQP